MRFTILSTLLVAVSSSRLSFKVAHKNFNRIAAGLLAGCVIGNNQVLVVNADARLNAPTAAGTRVNSDPESLLRYGLPIKSKELRDIQENLELAKLDLKTRRIAFAKNDVNTAKSILLKNADKIIKLAPSNHVDQVKESIERMKNGFPVYDAAIAAEMEAGSGSLQERKGLDDSFAAQDILAKELTTLEQLLVPDDFKRTVPDEYADLPQLQGRAEVEVVFKRPDGSQFDVDGKLYDDIKLKLVLDGYNAPVTAGNIVDLIQNHFYDKKPVTRSDGFVVQLGDANPSGEVHGYVPPGAKEERKVPLEISFKDDPDLLYGSTSEDDGRGYAAATLPFQSYGALGMARAEFEADSASSQFFFLLFESDLTPAGKNMLDGRYTCFGYTTENNDLLKGIKEGDIISSMKVIKGLDKFKPGKSNAVTSALENTPTVSISSAN